jgi:hypothetical protein
LPRFIQLFLQFDETIENTGADVICDLRPSFRRGPESSGMAGLSFVTMHGGSPGCICREKLYCRALQKSGASATFEEARS